MSLTALTTSVAPVTSALTADNSSTVSRADKIIYTTFLSIVPLAAYLYGSSSISGSITTANNSISANVTINISNYIKVNLSISPTSVSASVTTSFALGSSVLVPVPALPLAPEPATVPAALEVEPAPASAVEEDVVERKILS